MTLLKILYYAYADKIKWECVAILCITWDYFVTIRTFLSHIDNT